MLVVQDADQLGSVLDLHAGALDRRSKGLVNVRRGALQTDGVGLDERIVLQSVVIKDLKRLVVALEDTGNAHVTRGVQLLDAGQQAGSLDLQLHVAVLELTLDGQAVAVLLNVSDIGDLDRKSTRLNSSHAT